MNIAIIGSNGFIGTELSMFLSKTGNYVIACDLFEVPNQKLQEQKNCKYFCIKNFNKNNDLLKITDCMVILAGKRLYDGFCISDYINNIQILETYFNLAVSAGIKNIIFASSKAVYSGNNYPWAEDDYSIPSSLYGASKLACEQIGLFYAQKNNKNFKALRFAQVIGKGERKGYLINTFIDNAIAKKPQIIFGSGEQRRHYIYIKDICRAVLCAAKHTDVSGVFNIGMEQTVSNIEMAECINDVFDNKGNIIHDYNQKMNIVNDAMKIDKAKKFLDFIAQYNLEKTFQDIKSD